MNIQLKNTRVEALAFTSNDDVTEDDFSLSFSCGFTEENSDFFLVKFEIKVESEMGYKIDLEYSAEFQTDETIDEQFKESMFPIVNAPAIAYPFLRSFVSLITLNSGYEPLMLPTVNFQAMANDMKKESSK